MRSLFSFLCLLLLAGFLPRGTQYVFPLDNNGWSIITPTSSTTGTCAAGTADGSCLIYVTSSGNDGTCGLEDPPISVPVKACKTLAKALTLSRASKPDWILLHRGETFTNLAGLNIIGISLGTSAQKPWVMSAYPQAPSSFDDRPIIDSAGQPTNSGGILKAQAGTFAGVFLSLRFKNTSWEPTSPNYWAATPSLGNTLTIIDQIKLFMVEDCEFDQTAFGNNVSAFNVTFQSSNTIVRRNVFHNNSAPPSLGGIEADKFSNALIEENLYYQDWSNVQTVQTTVSITAASPAVITYPAAATTPPESGGIPPRGIFGFAPLIALTGALPTGLSPNVAACPSGTGSPGTGCYYLCNISGATANLSTSSSCASVINTTGSSCANCKSIWVDPGRNQFSHNFYGGLGWDDQTTNMLATYGGLIFRNNITAYASATGLQSRPGGTLYNNLFLKNPIQITCCGWASHISYNVVLQGLNGTEANADRTLQWGFMIASYTCGSPALGICTQALINNPPTLGSAGTSIDHNIIAASDVDGSANGIGIELQAAQTIAIAGATFNIPGAGGISIKSNIICDWKTFNNKPYFDNSSTGSNTIDNTNLPDPTSANTDHTCASLGISSAKTVGQYYDSIVGGSGHTTDDFLNAALLHWTKISWDTRYLASSVNAFIRPSYGLANP